jgi:hypothetical protein
MSRSIRLAVIALLTMAQAPVAVTLTPQEYQGLMTDLAQRDPVMKFLLAKQQAAQEAAKAENKDAPRQ